MSNTNAKTLLITGCTSGIGSATVSYFSQKGWNILATARRVEKLGELESLPNVATAALDVTRVETITAAVSRALDVFGRIDVVINNAGYGLLGVFEATPEAELRKQIETNYFGVQNVIRAVLPQMREQRSGTIINVSSIGGRMAGPLYSSYHASKFAIEGFTESLRFELAPFGIRVKLVEPGPVSTEFFAGSKVETDVKEWPCYAEFQARVIAKMKPMATRQAEPPINVAKTLYCAASDRNDRLRYVSGKLAGRFLAMRSILPDAWIRRSMVSMLDA